MKELNTPLHEQEKSKGVLTIPVPLVYIVICKL